MVGLGVQAKTGDPAIVLLFDQWVGPAVLWIANSIANGWPVRYVITAVLSLGMFALGVGAMWVSRRRRTEPEPNFGNTLEAEVRRSLALVDDQLSITGYSIIEVLGAVSLVVGTLLFSWTVNRSQGIPDLPGSWWFIVLTRNLDRMGLLQRA